MIAPHGQLRVYVATRPVDFRKGMDGLALAVQEIMGLDPFCGAAFVFRAKRADRIKILIWDRTGMVFGGGARTGGALAPHCTSASRAAPSYGRRCGMA
jgi:transposase